MKPLILVIAAICFCTVEGYNQELNPGVSRWVIKTTLPKTSSKKTVPFNKLLLLPAPINSKTEAPENERIPRTVNGLKEGDIITTSGWLELVALENDSEKHRDGDYHIQIRNTAEWGDSCLIVEIPYADFISDPDLQKDCMNAREFVKTRLLKNAEPGTAGNKMTHPVYVTLTGQLFFDAEHLKGNPRGKRGMRSYTCWEIHPVTHIAFTAPPAIK